MPDDTHARSAANYTEAAERMQKAGNKRGTYSARMASGVNRSRAEADWKAGKAPDPGTVRYDEGEVQKIVTRHQQ